MKFIVFFFFFLLSINYVIALECQYKDIDNYKQIELGLYDESGNYVGHPLVLKDFRGGQLNLNGCTQPSFKIYNPLDFDIKLNLTFFIARDEASSGNPISGEYSIPSFSDIEIIGNCPDIGGWIIQNKTNYIITSPQILSLKNVEVTKQREICKICPNGKQCLDDGAVCNLDNECGFGICNQDKKCGKFTGCSDGKKLCNNISCLTPSVKEVGEPYSCIWECKSDRFENGICLKSSEQLKKEKEDGIKQLVIFGVIIFIIVLISFLYIEKWKRRKVRIERKKEEEKLKELKNDIVKLKEDKGKINEDIKNDKKEIQRLENQKNTILKEIKELEEKIKYSKGKMKEKYEQELIMLKNQNKKTEEKIKIQRKGLSEQENQLKSKEAELEKRTEAYWKEKSMTDSGQRQNLRFNEKGYLMFKDSGKLFHVWKYEDYLKKKGQKIPDNISVHHIDRNHHNNEIWNLVPIDKNVHDIRNGESLKGKFNHNLIESYNWLSGINQIKDQLGWEDTDFPEHIQKEIKRRK